MGKENALHLQKAIEENYDMTTDWTVARYIGITIDWDYKSRRVHLSMPVYVNKALKQLHHIKSKNQHSPFQITPIKYGANK